MSKQKKHEYKPESKLDLALTFILNEFSKGAGAFCCPYQNECLDGDCDNCDIQKDYNEIFGL